MTSLRMSRSAGYVALVRARGKKAAQGTWRLMGVRPRRLGWLVAAFVAAALVAIVWSQKHTSRSTTNATIDVAQSPSESTASERLATVDRSLKALENAQAQAPRDRWDPAYVVGRLGSDPRVLLEWVRRNTTWIPYRGILRGATGVLMDRQGNSLDRAILLATLLGTAGHKVRLAHAELSDAEALTRIRSAPGPEEAAIEPESRGISARWRPGDGKALRARSRSSHPYGGSQQPGSPAGFGRDPSASCGSDQSAASSGGANRRQQRLGEPRIQEAVSARRDHWWVQVDSEGTWIDLDIDEADDTSLPSLIAQRTLLLEDLPTAGLHHEIAVRVIAEQWSRGTVAERTAMESTLQPAELIGKPIVVQFLPDSAVPDFFFFFFFFVGRLQLETLHLSPARL